MSKSFEKMLENAQSLRQYVPNDLSRGAILDKKEMSRPARKLLDALEPLLDSIDWDNKVPGPKSVAKYYTDSAKLLTALMIRKTLLGRKRLEREYRIAQESTVAGSGGIGTFGRQLIAVIQDAFPSLYALQLFPVVPLVNGPEGRVYFDVPTYGTAYASSNPQVTAGNALADLTKFNRGYANKGQLELANEIDVDHDAYVTVSATTKRVRNLRSIEAEEDYEDQFGGDYDEMVRGRLGGHLRRTIDSSLVWATLANILSGHTVTWEAEPTINSLSWANQLPTEKRAWEETLVTQAINSALTKVREKRYVEPNWILCGSKFAEILCRTRGFMPIQGADVNQINISRRGIRDMGTLVASNLRVMTDYVTMPTNKALLGFRPDGPGEAAIHYCPLRAITFMGPLTRPGQHSRELAAYTRFGIAQPDGGVPDSDELAKVYSVVEITNYS